MLQPVAPTPLVAIRKTTSSLQRKGECFERHKSFISPKAADGSNRLISPARSCRPAMPWCSIPTNGTAMLPIPETGWSEAWIGFAGEEANALLRKFFPHKSHPIFQVGVFDALCAAYEQAYAVAENLLPAYQQQLIGYVWLIITSVYARSQQLPYLDNPDMTGISNAIRYMRQHISSNIRMEEVAKQAGMGYSKFRKVFKNCTGFAPAQYFLRLKMERAKDYLQATDFSCKEITYRLGFDSASHFNKMFRLYEGVTPTQFRNS